jgi:hypothetical protein
VVVHTLNPSTWETEASGSQRSRTARSTQTNSVWGGRWEGREERHLPKVSLLAPEGLALGVSMQRGKSLHTGMLTQSRMPPSNSSRELVQARESEEPICTFFEKPSNGLKKPWMMLCVTQDRGTSIRRPTLRNIPPATFKRFSSIVKFMKQLMRQSPSTQSSNPSQVPMVQMTIKTRDTFMSCATSIRVSYSVHCIHLFSRTWHMCHRPSQMVASGSVSSSGKVTLQTGSTQLTMAPTQPSEVTEKLMASCLLTTMAQSLLMAGPGRVRGPAVEMQDSKSRGWNFKVSGASTYERPLSPMMI